MSYGLKESKSTPSKPRAFATSSGCKFPSAISVVVGVITLDPLGAVKVVSAAKNSPEDASTAVPSEYAINFGVTPVGTVTLIE